MKRIVLLIILLLIPSVAFAGITFDGMDDVLNVDSPAGLNAPFTSGQPYSIVIWGNFNSDGENDTGKFLDKQNAAGTAILSYSFAATNAAYIITYNNGPTMRRKSSNSTVPIGSDTCIVFAGTSTTSYSTHHIYVDGSETSYQTEDDAAGAWLDHSGGPAYIGNRGGLDRTLDGTLYRMGIWNQEFNSTQASDICSNVDKDYPIDSYSSNMVAYWKLEDGVAGQSANGTSNITDSSGNGNTLSGANGPVWTSEVVVEHGSILGDGVFNDISF